MHPSSTQMNRFSSSAASSSTSHPLGSDITVANLHEHSLLTNDLLAEDDPVIQQEILHLIGEYMASIPGPGLPHTLASLKEEMDLRSREEDERESERERLSGRMLDGDWPEAERLLAADPGLVRNPKAFLYKLYRQQFLELIEARESQKAFNLLLRRLKPLEHYQSYPTEFRDLSYLLSARAVSEAGESFDGWKWGGPAEGREELVEVLRGMQMHTNSQDSVGMGVVGRNEGGRGEGGGGEGEGGTGGGSSSDATPYVPPNRLMTLLRQAAAWQVYFSRYHPKVLPTIHTLLHDYTPFVLPNQLKDTYKNHSANVKAVAFLGASGTRLISGSSDATLSIVSTTSTPLTGPSRLLGHTSRIWDVDSTESGSFAASASGDGTVRIWETEKEGKCLAVLGGASREGDVYSVRWGRGKNEVVTGGYDKILKLYDVERGQIVKTFTGHTQPVTSTVFGPEGKVLVSGSTDRQIKVWDVSSGVLVHSIASSLGEISSVDIDHKGHHLLVSSKDNSNTLFDLRMFGRQLKRFGTHQNTSRNFIRSKFAHSSLIVGGSEDGLVYLWSQDQSEPLQTLQGHGRGAVYDVVWNDAQQLLASCGEDRTVRTWVWEAEKGEEEGKAQGGDASS